MTFPDEADIVARHEARVSRTTMQRQREERFKACVTPDELAELIAGELREAFRQGEYHPAVTVPYNRSALEAWIAEHNPPPSPGDPRAAYYNPTLQYAIAKAVETYLDLRYVFRLECEPVASGELWCRMHMKTELDWPT